MDLNVVYAEPNYLYQLCNVPNDPLFAQQWALHNSGQLGGTPDADIDAPEAWDVSTGSSDVIIAIIDSGIDYTHEDMADNIWTNSEEVPNNGVDDDNNGYIDDLRGWDFYNDDNDPMDDFGHGTFCAGIAGAVTDNGVGVSGVCWNCKIMPLKAGFNSLSSSNAAEGIVYATDNGADVISMSWGKYSDSSLTREVLDYAYGKGLVLIGAAGNMNVDTTHYPSGYDNVIAVTATDDDDYKASFSKYGKDVDISAPGVNILSLRAKDTDIYGDGTHIVDENYYIASGTSASCPFGAGVAGLVLSKNPNLGHDGVKAILQNSVDKLIPYEEIGKGRLNAYYAVMQGDSLAKAEITSPSHGKDIAESIDIYGTAMGEDFQYFVLEYGKGRHPGETSWIEIVNSTTPVEDNVIGSLDTVSIDEGIYNIRLKVIFIDSIYIDNMDCCQQ
jgi:subtilisin family serine protease